MTAAHLASVLLVRWLSVELAVSLLALVEAAAAGAAVIGLLLGSLALAVGLLLPVLAVAALLGRRALCLPRDLWRGSRAVSPVAATVLLVVITAVIALVLYVLIIWE
ncbi:MAG: hypothetical protein ACREEC_01985, partial [Thermoplasmata archaeon]